MTGITPEELDAMEARCDAAMEGPWETALDCMRPDYLVPDRWVKQAGPEGMAVFCWGVSFADDAWTDCEEEDATFIAHARTDMPRLIAEVRQLREEATALRVRIANDELRMKSLQDSHG